MKHFRKILAVAMIALLMVAAAACGSKEPDPNAGVYHAYTAEMMGFTIGVKEVYPEGFTIELKDGGKSVLTIGDQSAKGKWTLEGTELHVEGGGVELDGSLADNLMVFENVMDSGLDMTFLKEGAKGPEFTSITELVEQMEALAAEMEAASK